MADLAYAAVIEKITNEEWNEAFNFEGRIDEGTTVTDYEVTITRADGVNVTDDMWVAADSSISSQTVTLKLKSLTTETAYVIGVTATASNLEQAHMKKILCVDEPGVYR